MDFNGLLLYIFAVILLGITPGQAVAALLNLVIGQGRKAAIAFNFGLSLGDIFWLALAIYGLKMVEGLVPILRIVGVFYVFYLSFMMWKNADSFGEARPIKTGSYAFFGLMLTLSNPKVMLFYLAIVPAVLPLQAIGFNHYLLLCVITSTLIFSVNLLYILLAEKLFALIKNRPTLIKIRRVNALALGLLGVYILFL